MKKSSAFIIMLLCIACLVLSSCGTGEMWIWGSKKQQNIDGDLRKKTYKVYVCGAVENEGYYEVLEGAIYLDAIVKAGLLQCSRLTDLANKRVDRQQSTVVVQYVEDGKVRYCYDVNWEYFSLRLPMEGLSPSVVDKIADYLETRGKITNKAVLLEILGAEDYAEYHYKLYIAEADFEEAD